MKVTAGIDVGANSVKVAVLAMENGGARPLALVMERIRKRDIGPVVEGCYERALARAGLEAAQVDYVASTGAGELVEFRTGHFYGMTSHARGAIHLDPEVRTVLDLGAFHARAMRVSPEARVLAHKMTGQCASGSGQFVENIARYLGVPLAEVGELSLRAGAAEQPSGICAVLAETDVINMVSRGIAAENILKGADPAAIKSVEKAFGQQRVVRIGADIEKLFTTRGRRNVVFNVERVLITETNRVNTESFRWACRDAAGAIGMRRHLSPSHPRYDICDELANANRYGLGPGGYPFDELPDMPHPLCMCYETPIFEWEIRR